MASIGYARVSTVDQDTRVQVEALLAFGVCDVFEEKRSGVLERPQLEIALGTLAKGDVFVVYKVDRLARSLVDLLRIIAVIDTAGASLKSLTEPIETGSALGRLMIQLLGSFAEFERCLIRERCQAGVVAARARGVRFGRACKVSPSEVLRLSSEGFNGAQIARLVGLDRSHVTRVIRRYIALT